MKNILLICGFVALSAWCFGAVVSVQDAQTVAVNYFKSKKDSKVTGAKLSYTHTEPDGLVDFYAFNMTPKGFVIVSAQDLAEPVLAWSDESDFTPDLEGHNGVTDWTTGCAQRISTAVRQGLQADSRIRGLWNAWRNGVAPQTRSGGGQVLPLLQTTWDQSDGTTAATSGRYNGLCPFNSTDNERCVTGCVATGMAQVMKYWNFPASGLGSNSYVDNMSSACAGITYPNNFGTLSVNFAATTYQWNLMPAALAPATGQQYIDAVNTLMYSCGVAVNMAYGDYNECGSASQLFGGKGSPSAEYAFWNYFGYSPCMNDINNINTLSEVQVLEAELSAGRPFLFTGYESNNDGHCWAGDGFDASDNIHMNWGWGGTDNGYYNLLSSITPGPTNENTTFVTFNALINIRPILPAVTLSGGIVVTPPAEAYDTIDCVVSNIIPAGGRDTFIAGHAIFLESGFIARPGSIFVGEISTCANSSSNTGPPLTNAPAAINLVNSNNDDMQIIPNPFNTAFEVSVNINQEQQARISVYNTLGERIQQISPQQLTAGNNKIPIDLTNCASGMYLVEIKTGDTIRVKKVVKN